MRAAELTGAQQQVADYLLEEVLGRQPGNLKLFLLGTSILDRMTASLSDAVLGTPTPRIRSRASRARMRRRSARRSRRMFRYHHLFSDLLRRSSTSLSGVAPHVPERAAACYGPHGSVRRRTYSHESGDLAQAGTIALRQLDGSGSRADRDVRLSLDGCTRTRRSSDARCRSRQPGWQCCSAIRSEQADRRRGRAETARRAIRQRGDVAAFRASDCPVSRSYRRNPRDAARCRVRLHRGEARRAPGGFSAPAALCRPRTLSSADRKKRSMCSVRHSLCRATGRSTRTSGLLSQLYGLRGRGDGRSAKHAEIGDRSLQLVEEAHLDESAPSTIPYAAGALAHQQRGDHTAATQQLENVRGLRPLLQGVPSLEADYALRCTDISLDLGGLNGALGFARVASNALQGYPDAGTLPARLQRFEERIRRRKERAHTGRAPADRVPADTSLAAGDRRSSLPLTSDRQDPVAAIYREARCQEPVRSHRDGRAVRPRGGRRSDNNCGIPTPAELASSVAAAQPADERYRPMSPIAARSSPS